MTFRGCLSHSLGLFRDSVTSSRESVLTSSPLGRVPLPCSSSIQSPLEGHLGSFQFGVIVKKASLCAHVQVLVWTSVFLSFGSIPTSGIAGLHGKCTLNVTGNCQQFSQVVVPFCVSPRPRDVSSPALGVVNHSSLSTF